MHPSVKILLATTILGAGFAATVAIGQYATDDNLLPFVLALILFCFAYWHGGRLFAEGWLEVPVDLGKPLVDHLRYNATTSSSVYIAGFWSQY